MFLKEKGAPDAFLALVALLLLVIALSWTRISVGNITIPNFPWGVSLFCGIILILLFVPCIPAKSSSVSSAEKELMHRFEWLRRHLLVKDLTIASAYDAQWALIGSGGTFHAAEDLFFQKNIEPILYEAPSFVQWNKNVTLLLDLYKRFPKSWRNDELLQEDLALEFKKAVADLPSRHSV